MIERRRVAQAWETWKPMPVYVWLPQADITLYELAMALNVLLPGVAGRTRAEINAVVEALPEPVKRHFAKRAD